MSDTRLEIGGLSRRFGGLAAVSDFSMTVTRGRIAALIGPNGAGKSTVFNCVAGAIAIDTGDVRLDGASIAGLRPDQICRQGVARTFQIARPLKALSVLENARIGAFLRNREPRAAEQAAREALDAVGIAGLASRIAGDLSVPERKRLEIARCLATRPSLLLLDEVFAGLSAAEVDRLADLLRAVHRSGIDILLIEHVMRAVMTLSDRVTVLVAGRKIAEGRPEEIVANPDVIEAYLGRDHARG
jgi:branched-chain amino acid transport system ATP-binding protein